MTETGDNLHVLIRTRATEDWRAFATWYSVTRNLPDASVSIVCRRVMRVEYQCFQWARRLGVSLRFVNPFFRDEMADLLHDVASVAARPLLVLDDRTVVADVLTEPWLERLNADSPWLACGRRVSLVRGLGADAIAPLIDGYAFRGQLEPPAEAVELATEARASDEPEPVLSYGDGCGRWLDSAEGCPFSNADGMVRDAMTVNELRVVQLWRRMVPLYSAVK